MYWGLRAHTGDSEEQCYCIIHNSGLPQISKPTGQKMQKKHPEPGPEKQVSFICTALAQQETLFAEYLWKTLLIFRVSEQFHEVGLRSPRCKKQDPFQAGRILWCRLKQYPAFSLYYTILLICKAGKHRAIFRLLSSWTICHISDVGTRMG